MILLLFDGSEVPLQFGELWSVLRVVLPAALHHLVHIVGTTLRTGHPVTLQQEKKMDYRYII